jgi:hypothetical protein
LKGSRNWEKCSALATTAGGLTVTQSRNIVGFQLSNAETHTIIHTQSRNLVRDYTITQGSQNIC